jgi:hypothetical protein
MKSPKSPKERPTTVKVTVTLSEVGASKAWPEMAAYAFARSGRLLAKAPLERSQKDSEQAVAILELGVERGHIAVKVGPDLEDPVLLGRHDPATKNVLVAAGKPALVELELPKPVWICWLKAPYVVTGTVDKVEDGHSAPICSGTVDIYDVDIGFCLRRLPDIIIERVRDAFIDVLLDPPPVYEIIPEKPHGWWDWDDDDWCGSVPRPPFPPPPELIIRKLEALPPAWAGARQRFENLASARARATETLDGLVGEERRLWLANEFIEGVPASKILYSNTAQLRALLIDKFQAFRYCLCWYPWIYWLWWPFCWYSLEKLGTAALQLDGSFSKIVWLSVCRRDTPDLWFVVRQRINGIERVIYARHPVPCNTYWNHPSGQPVHLVVTDPDAVSCYEDPQTDLDPDDLWVVPLAIGNYSLKRVYGTGAGSLPADNAKIGLYESISTGLSGALSVFNDGPFGATLGLRVLFSRALETANVKYYRIKYRKNGSGAWTTLDHEVVRHYSAYNAATTSLEFKPYHLGPQTVGGTPTLFEIPPKDPPNASTDPYAAWYVIDATVDLMNAYLNTSGMTHGYVDFKVELFNSLGVRVDPATFGAGGIPFKLPSNTDVWNTVTTADAATVNPNLVVSDPEDPAFQVFMFRLQVDNRAPTANILAPTLSPSGSSAGPCGMIEFDAADTSATLPYEARHPMKYAMYRFRLFRAKAHLSAFMRVGQVGDLGPSGEFAIVADLRPDPLDPSKPNLLNGCPAAAFSENLYIWNMAFNGWNRVGADANDVRAFALVPASP